MEKQRWEQSEKSKSHKKEDAGARKGTVFFQSFVAPEGRKVGLLKRRMQSHLGRWEMKNCTPLWREAHFEVKMCKTHTMFGSWDVGKVHGAVARSAFPRQNGKNATCSCSDHFGVSDVEKVHAVVVRCTFRSQNAKENTHVRTTFGY